MSGFLSTEAERALTLGGEEAAQLFFNEQTTATPFVDESSAWMHAHTSSSGLDYFHPQPVVLPSSSASTSPEQLSGRLAPTSGAASRSSSPNPADLHNYGTLNNDNRTWRCAYPGCNSKAMFVRPCDLRKHFNRHSKSFFCRHEECPQSMGGGFSSKKDRTRHEAKHNPGVKCEWEGCERIFSRVDNMRDHLRRSKFGSLHHY